MLKTEVMLVSNQHQERTIFIYRVRKKRYKSSIKLGTEKKNIFCIRNYQICRDTDWERDWKKEEYSLKKKYDSFKKSSQKTKLTIPKVVKFAFNNKKQVMNIENSFHYFRKDQMTLLWVM